MANEANTFSSLQALFKTVYPKGSKSKSSPKKNKYSKLVEMIRGKGLV